MHKSTNTLLANKAQVAESFFERLKGLMFIKEMKGFDALLIKNCNSVHNCFVRFSIDLVFINQDWEIVKIVRGFRPWRFSWIYFKARHVIEFPAGTIGMNVKEGDILEAQGV